MDSVFNFFPKGLKKVQIENCGVMTKGIQTICKKSKSTLELVSKIGWIRNEVILTSCDMLSSLYLHPQDGVTGSDALSSLPTLLTSLGLVEYASINIEQILTRLPRLQRLDLCTYNSFFASLYKMISKFSSITSLHLNYCSRVWEDLGKVEFPASLTELQVK